MASRRAASVAAVSAIAVASVLLLPLPPVDRLLSVAQACSCSPPPSPSAARDAAAVVFLGTVTSVGPPSPSAPVTLSVERVFKGKLPSTVVAHTRTGGTCGVAGAEVGTRWLVYSVERTPLELDACSGTKLAQAAAAELAVLGVALAPPAVGVSAKANSASPEPVAPLQPEPPRGGCACTVSARSVSTHVWGGLLLLLLARARRAVRPRGNESVDQHLPS